MARINGSPRNDILTGTELSDTINGLGGDDTIHGRGGPDGLYGGTGIDRMFGGAGIDALFGQDGNDKLYGEAGNDYINGGSGDDVIGGGSGDDVLRGEAGDDWLDGSPGNDNLAGGSGNDTLNHSDTAGPAPLSGPGKSVFDGGSGYDVMRLDVHGDFEYDNGVFPFVSVLQTEGGSATIGYSSTPFEGTSVDIGSSRNIEEFRLSDTSNAFDFTSFADVKAVGGNDADVFKGFSGDQVFVGNGGADTFLFSFRQGDTDAGNDTILTFNAAEGDRVLFRTVSDPDGEESPFILTRTEADGFTTYTSTDIDTGAVVHTLRIDAVGLPDDGYFG